jgi:hypothetical protein
LRRSGCTACGDRSSPFCRGAVPGARGCWLKPWADKEQGPRASRRVE